MLPKPTHYNANIDHYDCYDHNDSYDHNDDKFEVMVITLITMLIIMNQTFSFSSIVTAIVHLPCEIKWTKMDEIGIPNICSLSLPFVYQLRLN